jgi:hypothetical protein
MKNGRDRSTVLGVKVHTISMTVLASGNQAAAAAYLGPKAVAPGEESNVMEQQEHARHRVTARIGAIATA